MYDADLTKAEQAIADLLHERKPQHIEGSVMQATASVFWYTLVRDMADRLFKRPNWATLLTTTEKKWLVFTDRAGYNDPEGDYQV